MKCAVFCRNASGEPDIFYCQIDAHPIAVQDGEHYEQAVQLAIAKGYEGPFLACDEYDPAGAVMQLCTPARIANEGGAK